MGFSKIFEGRKAPESALARYIAEECAKDAELKRQIEARRAEQKKGESR